MEFCTKNQGNFVRTKEGQQLPCDIIRGENRKKLNKGINSGFPFEIVDDDGMRSQNHMVNGMWNR